MSEPSSGEVLDVEADPPGPSRPDARRRAAARPRDRRRVRAVGRGQDDLAPVDRRTDHGPIPAASASTATTLFDAGTRDRSPLRRRRIGMIFQDDRLFPHLSVAANIRFGLKGWRRDRGRRPAGRGRRALRRGAADGSVAGDALRRRAATGRPGAGAGARPRLLLCDEPVSALDLANRHAMVGGSATSSAPLAIPMLYVTHSVAEAVALGSRLFLLERGRIVAEGPPLDVLAAARRSAGRSDPASKACATSSRLGSTATPPSRSATRSPRRRSRADRRRSSTGPPGRGSWSRSAPTTSCSPASRSPASPPATRSPARSSGSSPTVPRPRPSSAPAD